ncbi:MAG: hypothetical protein NTW19_22115 [Planctomycetota bacterium]|nr:hypothetical protein [Planctomycetota bacterium]
MSTLELLLDRVRAQPEWMGRKSVDLILPFVLGYIEGRHRCGAPPLTAELSLGVGNFQEWVESRFGWTSERGCRQSVIGFARLLAGDEQQAFDLYFSFRDEARGQIRGTPDSKGLSPEEPRRELLEFIMMPPFRERPALYFGRPSVDALGAFCNGYDAAEKDLRVDNPATRSFLDGFQRWAEARFPFPCNRPWNDLVLFLALGYDDRAWEHFYSWLDEFLEGRDPRSLSRDAEAVLANITKVMMRSRPDADPDEIAAAMRKEIGKVVPP